MLRLGLAMCIFFISTSASIAASESIPTAMNYQGKLTDSTGKPVADGSYPVSFKLYKDEKDEQPLWTSAPLYVNTFGGLFNTLIGNIPGDVFDAGQLYLETLIKDVPLKPRQQILSVGYAFRAQKAYDVADGSVSSSKIAPGAVTGNHLSLPLNISSPQTTGAPVKSTNSSTLSGIGLWGSTNAEGSGWLAAGVAGNQGSSFRSPREWNSEVKRMGVYGYSNYTGTTTENSGHGVVGWSEYGYGGLFHSTNAPALAVEGTSNFTGDLTLSGSRTINADSGVTINGPGNLDVVVGTNDITIRGDSANTYIKILSDGTIQVKSAGNMSFSAGGILSLSGASVNIDSTAGSHVYSGGLLDMKGTLIKLN